MTKQSKAQEFIDEILDKASDIIDEYIPNPYPIGSIYMTVSSTNPSELFGGTWVQIKDTFLLACGDNYTADSSDKNTAQHGEATHQLTQSEMTRHKHSMITKCDPGWNVDGQAKDNMSTPMTYSWQGSTVNVSYVPHSVSKGGNQAHNNMPPYLIVYMWKRTE